MRVRTRALIAYNGADAGLGNRVRVVLGCRSLADFEDRAFCYVWPTTAKFEPALTDLWDHRGGVRISRSVSRTLARLFPYEGDDARSSPGPRGGPRVRQIRTGGSIKLPDGARAWKDDFRALQPVAEIAEQVRRFHSEHLAGVPYVGVQIRAHGVSHEVTKQASPVDWYRGRMREIAEHDPQVRFFVSCDVPEVFHRIRAEIPQVVGIADKGAYNSTAAVRAAIADLYLLAGSGHLIGPYGSSFVHLAEYLAHEKHTLETSRSALSGPVDVASMGLVTDPLRPALRS